MKQAERESGLGGERVQGRSRRRGVGRRRVREGVREEERSWGGLLKRKGNRTVFWDQETIF